MKRRGKRDQPWRKSSLVVNFGERSPQARTNLRLLAHRDKLNEMNYSGTPFLQRETVQKSLYKSTKSNATFKLRNIETVGPRNMSPCSKISRKGKIWPIQLQTGRKLAYSSNIHLSQVIDNHQRIRPTSSLHLMLTKLIHLWLSHEDPSSFVLIGTITDSHVGISGKSTVAVAQTNSSLAFWTTLHPTLLTANRWTVRSLSHLTLALLPWTSTGNQ